MAEKLKQVSAQSLECPVCLNIFKDPKILSCSHTFCKTCLENLQCHGNDEMVRCPVCRAYTMVPKQDISQLQSNLVLKSLLEDVENQHQVCTVCKSEEKHKAVIYCKDCGKYLCTTCNTKHSQWDDFSDHEVFAMTDIQSGKVSVRKFRKCRKHPREDEECFCCNCRKFACFRCGIMEHKDEGHRVIEASLYERNHLKTVQDFKSKADIKLSSIQKYVDLIDEQKDLVSTAKKQCIDNISKVYDESVRLLTEKKELLIGEVYGRTKDVDKELDTMKEEAQQQITFMNTVTDLVANGMKIPFEMDALAAHDTLCEELQDALNRDDPDYEQPRKLSKKGGRVFFERNVGVNELGLGKIVDVIANNIALPSKNSMDCMVTTPDGRMAVGCGRGIEIFSADGQLQETVLKDVSIRGIGFLSDGRCVVRASNNTITLYTAEWEKLDLRFKTLNDEKGGHGGLDVDSEDHIYVSYRKAKKIQVFSSIGGNAIREIPFDGYSSEQITMCNDLLIITHGRPTSISMIDKDGNVKHKVTEANMYGDVAVTQDNRILIAWVNHDEGLVSIDEYNKDLQHVNTLISDYKIEKPEKRVWYYLREFRSREIAFCTPDRLYIFNLEI